MGAPRMRSLNLNMMATAVDNLTTERPMEQLESDLQYLASNARIVQVSV